MVIKFIVIFDYSISIIRVYDYDDVIAFTAGRGH